VPSTVPLPLGALIGRDADLAEVEVLLAEQRMVTLVGPPGIGKTRMALELAPRMSDQFPGGTAVVELAKVAEPADVAQAIATALGVREEPGLALADTVASFLEARRYLLVLDNCEHLLESVARLASRFLQQADDLTLLATSREPLGVDTEVTWRVPPLSLPSPDGEMSSADSAAVRLFLDRAEAADPSFTATAETEHVIGEICRRLDGVALAIELAAARVDAMSPGQIAQRLDERFELLTTGSRAAVEHHQTLRAALDWSYGLLADEEAAVLRRLSVFAGGCTADAAADVCGERGVERSGVPELLESLVCKSLVVCDEKAWGPRYRLLETIRDYGTRELEARNEGARARTRHAAWCIRLTEAGERELYGSSRAEWIERFEVEHDNVRAALRWAAIEGRADEAMRLASAMTIFWSTRGYLTEGRTWLMSTSRLGAAGASPLRARVLWGAGFLAELTSDYRLARDLLGHSLAIAEQSGDSSTASRALMTLGICALFLSDQGEAAARSLFERSCAFARESTDSWSLVCALAGLAWVDQLRGDSKSAASQLEDCVLIAREARDQWAEVTALNLLGTVALRQGDVAVAGELLSRTLSSARALGDPRLLADTLLSFGRWAVVTGDLATATDAFDEALTLGRRLGSRTAVLNASCELGDAARLSGDTATAHALFTECLSIAWHMGATCPAALLGLGRVSVATGDRWAAEALFERALGASRDSNREIGEVAPDALAELAELAHGRGDTDRAVELHRQALEIRGERHDPIAIADSLRALGHLAAASGTYADAVRLFAAADSTWHAADSDRRDPVERSHDGGALVRDQLPDDEWEAAWRDGTSWSVDEAVAFALEHAGGASRPPSGWDSLTKTEREVSALVAENLTNRQIGERLFVSPRTVQTHLSHIYSKLGISSRRDLAREISEGRLSANPLVPRASS
jgi:predicted ATPase/DNA-binding CsgD family transcriptional regulator